MKLIRRLSAGITAGVIAFSSLLTLAAPGIVHAAAQTCAWTGTAGDNLFSTATNWSGCGSAAPLSGDILTFDSSSLTGNVTVTNDISGLSVTGMTFTGTNTGNYIFTIAGPVGLAGDITTNAPAQFSGSLTMQSNSTISGSSYVDVTSTGSINVGTFTLTLTSQDGSNVAGVISGSGAIVGSSYINLSDASNFTGLMTVNTGILSIFPNKISMVSPITVSSGASLQLCGFNGSSVANPLTVSGSGKSNWGAIITAQGCNYGGGSTPTALVPEASVNWTGPITLAANTKVGGVGDFKISGSLSGAGYVISQTDGTVGTVTNNSTSNTSATPSGTQTSQQSTITYGENTPTTDVYIGSNQIGILAGTYNNATIAGGIFKGMGTLKGALSVYSGAIVAPGNSPGCITSDTLDLSGTYQFEIGGIDQCTGYDQLKVLNESNAEAAVSIEATSAVLTTSIFGDFTPVVGQTYVIIDQAGDKAVVGTFKDLPEGATFEQNGIVFKISYVGGDGNDIMLTIQSIPGTPDTGFGLLSSNPVGTLLLITLAGGTIVWAARRLNSSKTR